MFSFQFLDINLPAGGYMNVYDGGQLSSRLIYEEQATMPMQKIYTSNSKSVKILVSTPFWGLGRGVRFTYIQGMTSCCIYF